MSTAAPDAPLSPYEATARTRRSRRTVARIFWVLTLGTTMLGCFIGFAGIISANGAPQQAAAAGVALLVIIAPYVFARSVDEILRD